MTATTLSMTGTTSAPWLHRLTIWLLLAFVGSLQVSIAAANVLLSATILCWAALLIREHSRPQVPSFFWLLAAYGAVTLLSSAFSLDPMESLIDSRQLVLFLIVPMVYDLARGERAATVVDVIITVGAAIAAYGIVQYGMLHYDNLGRRPQGTLGHYMTYSGVLMLVTAIGVARLVFGARDRIWPALIMPALIVALSLTLGRSAWVGSAAAVGLLLILKDFRLTALLPVIIAIIFAAAPDTVADRMTSVFSLRDPSSLDRIAMARTGIAMVKDHPLTGVGPNMVERLYPQYRDKDGIQKVNPHLHNVPLQIAAERGIPALLVWLGFIGVLTIGVFQIFRASRDRVLPAAGLAAIAAMLAAGMFEYNFGDSEFLMLFLVIVTLPFAAGRPDHAPADRHA
jgi:O-antigen ligase